MRSLTPYRARENFRPETLIVAPYPFTGRPATTGARLQAVANLVHTDIVGMQARGTGARAIIDVGAYRALKTSEFARTCSAAVREVERFASDRDVLVGWGDSGRVTTIMGMLLVGDTFERACLRDGIKLHAPTPKYKGWLNFINYQLRGEQNKPHNLDDVPPPSAADLSRWRVMHTALTNVSAAAEMVHYRQYMLSEYTSETAMRLAQKPDLPIRLVSFTNSLAGSREQANAFAGVITAVRLGVLAAHGLPITAEDPRLNLNATVEEGYHSDLMRPSLAAKHIKEMFALPEISL